MARERKKVTVEGPKGAPAWMVTYGDMMTLLLVFFVFVVSFSTIEIEKFRAALGSFRGALMPWMPAATGMSLMKKMPISISDLKQLEAAEEIQAMVEEANLADLVEVYEVSGGVRIVFADPLLFDEGKDDLKPGARPILSRVVKVAVKAEAGEILIEGHTDDTPISTPRFPSNWELSTARALRILKFFQSANYPPERLVAVGYGEYRPRKKLPRDATVEEKGVNRRVEIFLNIRREAGVGAFPPSPTYGDGWGD